MYRRLSISILSVAVLASFALLIACGDNSPTASSSFEPAMSEMPAPGGNLSTGGGAELKPSDWTGTLTQEGNMVRGVATNVAKGPRFMGVACFKGQNFNVPGQERGTPNTYKIVSVPSGGTLDVKVALNCGHNQCDIFKDKDMAKFLAMDPPADFGRDLIKGDHFYYTCEHTPEDPGCPPGTLLFEEDGKCWPLCEERPTDQIGLELSSLNCEKPPEEFVPECICPDGTLETEYGCMTCDEANPPYLSDKKLYQIGNSGRIYGIAQAHNAGEWKMTLYRGNSYSDYKNDSPDHTLDTDTDHVNCDDDSELKTSHNDSLGTDYYWYVVTRNGEFVYKSDYLKT